MTRTISPAPLANLLRLDGFISFAFGVATALFPSAIFSTIIDLESAGYAESGSSLVGSSLLALSGYYTLVGAILVLLARVPPPYLARLTGAVAAHHAFMAGHGFADRGSTWVIGNPWPDIVIHSCYVAAYGYFLMRGAGGTERPPMVSVADSSSARMPDRAAAPRRHGKN